MIRYLALATAIVGIALFLLTLGRPGGPPLDARDVYATARRTPSPAGPPDERERDSPPPLVGDAPWVLSALPDCYRQIGFEREPRAIVARDAPPEARPIPPGSRLLTGTCTIDVAPETLRVRRGDDVERVTDVRRFYLARDTSHGDVLVLLRAGAGLPELRRYRFVAPSTLTVPGRGRVTLASKPLRL